MERFQNDYSECGHPNILDAIAEMGKQQNLGYGCDDHCGNAEKVIKKLLDRQDVDIHFLIGGTQANLLAISAVLRPYQAVIAVDTGHINVHECGAIEATGHKVLTRLGIDGKITPDDILDILDEHPNEHMVQPAMVYISNTTEIGTIYTKEELVAIHDVCEDHGLYLFLDGARLGSALCSERNDLSLSDLAELTDMFYIGGTKNGAMLGEAFVICNDGLKQDFRFMMKQKGGMLAKGYLIGVQFEELFRDGLFFKLADHANKMAGLLNKALKQKGYPMLTESKTNQIFPILPNAKAEQFMEKYGCELIEKIDAEHSCIRFVTSWATQMESVEECIQFIYNC